MLAAAAGGAPQRAGVVPEPAGEPRRDAADRKPLDAGDRRVAGASERAALWRAVCERNPAIADAERKAGREIPLVVLDVGVRCG